MNAVEDRSEAFRLAAVSYLNTRPLTYGLLQRTDVSIFHDVPAKLADVLEAGAADAALVPVVDMAKNGQDWHMVPDACIGCDGQSLTVRIFSRVPTVEIDRLHVDGDSHTSVALARVIWQERFGRQPEIIPLEAEDNSPKDAVLLIGDKVVAAKPTNLTLETDLGTAWKSMTGLPFVFAVWTARDKQLVPGLSSLLKQARDDGVKNAASIASEYASEHGWPAPLAEEYFTSILTYTLTPAHERGMNLFLKLAKEHGVIPDTKQRAGT